MFYERGIKYFELVMTAMKMLIPVMASMLVGGCLKFGDDIHLVAPDVTASELEEVSQRTGIVFPQGTTGLGYVFFGSGIDDSLAIKVAIPGGMTTNFLENDLFQGGDGAAASIQIGRGQHWWTPGKLKERKDYRKDLPQGRYVECTFGREGSRWIAYISWMST
ncbi:MAG: hypothetical protein VCA55_02880 [Verrucomicrobiales bacterium]